MDHEPLARDAHGKFVPGNGGRRPGTPWKINRCMKEAVILAAEEHGEDGRGKGQLTGFLRMLIRQDLRLFVGLMGRCIPTDLHVQTEPERRERSFEEVDADLAARGLDGRRLIEMGERMRQREAERARNGDGSLN